MTCAELDDRLDAWVDRTLPEADRREVESHLAACPACREQERRLRQLLAHASALPRSVSPPRDLWPEISRRIERERAWSRPRIRSWQPLLAVAAAVVIALLAVVLRQPAPTPPHTVVIPSPAAGAYQTQPVAVHMDPALVAMERDYQAAANALLAALQERKDELEPETLASVERNLAVIDEALAELHRALEKDPARPELGRMLVWTHRKRVDVLRKMVKYSTAL
ncbi:MAG: anti-sigma factor [Acidobacteriota bacterium]|jgi:anti-sigma factor RsiW